MDVAQPPLPVRDDLVQLYFAYPDSFRILRTGKFRVPFAGLRDCVLFHCKARDGSLDCAGYLFNREGKWAMGDAIVIHRARPGWEENHALRESVRLYKRLGNNG